MGYVDVMPAKRTTFTPGTTATVTAAGTDHEVTFPATCTTNGCDRPGETSRVMRPAGEAPRGTTECNFHHNRI